MRLDEIFSTTRTVSIDTPNGKSFNISYIPEMLTGETLLKFGALRELDNSQLGLGIGELAFVGDMEGALRSFVLECVSSWDLQYPDKTPIPITAEHLKRVPLAILAMTVSAIKLDAKPNPKTGSNSPAISSQVEG